MIFSVNILMIESMFLYITLIWYVTAIAISSDICLIDRRLRTLNVDRSMVLKHLGSCRLFRSVTNLSKSGARTVTQYAILADPRDDQCCMSFWFEVES